MQSAAADEPAGRVGPEFAIVAPVAALCVSLGDPAVGVSADLVADCLGLGPSVKGADDLDAVIVLWADHVQAPTTLPTGADRSCVEGLLSRFIRRWDDLVVSFPTSINCFCFQLQEFGSRDFVGET